MSYAVDVTTWHSPNSSPRIGVPTSIVCHSCEGALPSPRKTSLPWLCNPNSGVSTHYYVCRDTTIFQLVLDTRQAWHAGVAQTPYTNPHSIGVELEHRAGMDWPPAQKDALAWLLRQLIHQYAIPVERIETHGQIALPGPYIRKHDPSDWSHAAFVVWRDQLVTPLAWPSRCIGLPIYQRSDRTGALAGYLNSGDQVVIDNLSNGHLADSRGFVDIAGLETL